MNTIRKFKILAATLLMLFAFAAAVGYPSVVSAQGARPASQADCPKGTSFNPRTKTCDTPNTSISAGGLPQGDTSSSAIKTILSIVFGIIGALALLMIVVSGLRYVLSNGDPARITKAKDGIIYALLGLIIAITAEAIVAFVVDKL